MGLVQRLLTDDNFAIISALDGLARSGGHTPLELAFGWIMSRPEVATIIAAASNPEQVRSNAAAGGAWRLTPEDLAEVDRITLPATQE